MHSKKADAQQWSIQAEFTVLPQGVCAPEKCPPTNTIQGESGIRLSYCWKSNENANVSDTENYRSVRSNDVCRPIEYQKGNLIFSSTPPCRLLDTNACGRNYEFHDSGYGSDLFSVNSLASGSVKSPNSPNNRKCRSTCSIILRSSVYDKGQNNYAGSSHVKCERMNSLRCQTSAKRNTRQNTDFYGCGDPWCHHVNIGEELLSEKKVPHDIPTFLQPRIINTSLLPPHNIDVTDYKPYKKDVSIQTSDSLETFSLTNSGLCPETRRAEKQEKRTKSKEFEKTNRKYCKRNSNSHSQISSSTRGSGDKLQTCSPRKLVDRNCEISGHTSDSSKKSRTIHIDVYCTDTDMEQSGSSSDSWDNDSTSTPQTVFESENMSITHKRAGDTGLPYKLKTHPCRISNNIKYVEKDDSDDDETSTGYPSKISSYSTIHDVSSSVSSFTSWKNNSLSSYTNDYSFPENVNRTGIISNVTGIKSLMHDMHKKKSLDKPNSYEAHTQQAMGNKFENIYIGQSKTKNYEKNTVNPQSTNQSNSIITDNRGKHQLNKKITNEVNAEKHIEGCGNISLSETGLSRSWELKPSVNALREPSLSQNVTRDCPTSHSSIAVLPKQHTEQIASRFGEVINVLKKPGHHIGPTKNPDCCCDHCRRYFM